MKRPFSRIPLVRPWWRRPFQYLLRVRPRPRHVHGTLIHRLLGERLLAPALWVPNRDAAAKGVAVGTFVGMLPLPGLQIFFAALLCYFMRSNVAVAALATFVTNPFTAPGILWIQYKFGAWMLPLLRWTGGQDDAGMGWHFATYGKPLLVGSVLSATIGALLAYPIMHGLWVVGERAVRRRQERLRVLRSRHAPHPPEN